MKRLLDFFSKALASCFFITYPIVRFAHRRGWRRTGAGHVGTLAGVACAGYLPLDGRACAMALLGALFISVAISDRAEELMGQTDDQRIVIDEWIGYLVSIALLPKTPLILFSGFVLFRIIDTWKPLGIKRLDRLPGGWGIVMDDVGGGVVVNVMLHFLPHF